MAGNRVPFQYVHGIDGDAASQLGSNFEDLYRQLLELEQRVGWQEAIRQWQAVGTINIPYTNSWATYTGNGHQPASYRRVGDMTEFRGMIQAGTDATSAWTQLAGYRPEADSANTGDEIFPATRFNQVHGRLDVLNNGSVTPRSAAAITWFSIANARYSRTNDGWIEVAAANGPGFDGTWANFAGSTWKDAAFRKTADNEVQLRGLIASGTVGTSAFTLPTGFRPPRTVHLPCDTNSNAHGQIRIETNGQVIPSNGSNTYFSLGGCFFSLDPPGSNGWISFAPDLLSYSVVDPELYFGPEYRIRGDVVELRGLIAGPSATNFWQAPEEARPAHHQLFCVTAGGAHGHFSMRHSGFADIIGTTTGYVSLANVRYSILPTATE